MMTNNFLIKHFRYMLFCKPKRESSTILDLKQLMFPLDIIKIADTVQLFDNNHICKESPCAINFSGTHFYNI